MSNTGKWSSHRCEEKADYILCEKNFPKEQMTPKPTRVHNSSSFCKGKGWFKVKDSCFKQLQFPKTHEKAAQMCKQLKSKGEKLRVKPRLAIIKTVGEQKSLTGELYNELSGKWSVWLGARRVHGTNTFKWDDGNEMDWTNWAHNEPKSKKTGKNCVELFAFETSNTGNNTVKWRTVKCDATHVTIPLCQKIPKGTPDDWKKTIRDLQRAQEKIKRKLEKTVEDLTETKQKLEQTESDMENAKKDISDLKKRPSADSIPIGFIYVQLPFQVEPSIIFPNTTWKELSYKYAGFFFRVIGGGSGNFGSTQAASAPYLIRVSVNNSTQQPYSTTLEPGKCGQMRSYYGDHDCTTEYCISGGEVRPLNMAVKIWKRVA